MHHQPATSVKAPVPHFQGPAVAALPGWGTRKPAKIKKNSQRAKMMGSTGSSAESKFYLAVQGIRNITDLTYIVCIKQTESDSDERSKNESQRTTTTRAEAIADKEDRSTDSPASESISKNLDPVIDIICYGIGSLESSRNSQFQLALGLCLKDALKITGTIYIFDPVMTAFDQELSEKLGLEVIKVGDKTSKNQPLKHRTLLYMPHCPKGLYSHVLEANWTREQLDNMVILGNRFTMYDENPSFKHYAKQAPFILPALSIAQVSPLPAIKFEDNTIFNDIAFHCFSPHHLLPEVDLRDREEDPEML
ncbi:hypothetical protein BG004_003619 [Podila humilis]|nr:hypothetical protein BG004_003619 [Podila humilis]